MFNANFPDGKCVSCGLERGDDFHDPCIKDLPDVFFACCGHGADDGGGYVAMKDGRCLYFDHLPGESVRILVDIARKGKLIPSWVRTKTGGWFEGLTDTQFNYVWSRRFDGDLYKLVVEALEIT